MGKILKAQCKSCGFQSEDLYTGFGFQNAGDYYMSPAICPKCQSFALRDQRHPPQHCRRCRSEMAFYGTKELSSKCNADRKNEGTTLEDVGKDLLIGKHICPSCGKMEMIFTERGDWS